MKKLILLLLASLLLCACVQTPETEFVVNKGDNSVEEKMSSTAESSAQTFPAHWQEDPYTVNDYLSVSIDAEILQKTDGLYPVYRTRSAEISPEEALKYVNALLPAPTSVSGMEMTKEDWTRDFQQYLDQIAALQAWIDAGRPDDGVDRDEYMPDADEIEEQSAFYREQIEKAPEKNDTAEVSDYSGIAADPRMHRYTLQDGSTALIQYWNGQNIMIAKGCESGSYAYFDYYLKEDRDDPEMPWPAVWRDVTISREDAETILRREVDKLGFTDFTVMRASKGNLMDGRSGGAKSVAAGWIFMLQRNPAGYPTVNIPYEPSQQFQYGTNDTMANAYIRPEELEVVVDENGIQYFIYSSKKEIVGIENTNIELLPFEQVQTRIKNAIEVCYPTEWLKQSNQTAHVVVHRLLLTSYTLHIKGSDEYYEMPVWVVFYDDETYGDPETRRNDQNLMHDALFINAVDGSIVHTDWGY